MTQLSPAAELNIATVARKIADGVDPQQAWLDLWRASLGEEQVSAPPRQSIVHHNGRATHVDVIRARKRRIEVKALRAQNWTQQRIADHLGVPFNKIKRDCREIARGRV